jgi:3',5'-cyclic AMP phosphodiesterase CpdA
VTGDLINLSLSSEFALARAWLDQLGTPAEVTFVPGNHDSYVRAAALFAGRHWAEYMQGDLGEAFPFVRRRGPLALIGLSTSLPTLPLAATGRLHGDQLARLGGLLSRLADEQRFRVVLIHHPPTIGANRFRRLNDAPLLRAVLREHGAELILHGHHHEASIAWIAGPGETQIPVAGVPSASSGATGHREAPAGYNLYEIAGGPGAWRCTVVSRGLRDGGLVEIARREL